MVGLIQKKYKNLFNPTLRVVVMGQMIDVSLSQAENEAEKYALTGMGYMYENYKKLQKEVKDRQSKAELKILNMNEANRGSAFDKGSSLKAKSIVSFELNQGKRRAKVGKRKKKDVPVVNKTAKKKSRKKKVSKKK